MSQDKKKLSLFQMDDVEQTDEVKQPEEKEDAKGSAEPSSTAGGQNKKGLGLFDYNTLDEDK